MFVASETFVSNRVIALRPRSTTICTQAMLTVLVAIAVFHHCPLTTNVADFDEYTSIY